MLDFKDRKVQCGVVIGLIAAITVLRALEGETGPLYLIPIVIAGLWLGRWVGLGAGVASGLAILLGGGTTDLSGEAAPNSSVAADVIRVLVLGAVGYGVGVLSESRLGLERTLARDASSSSRSSAPSSPRSPLPSLPSAPRWSWRPATSPPSMECPETSTSSFRPPTTPP